MSYFIIYSKIFPPHQHQFKCSSVCELNVQLFNKSSHLVFAVYGLHRDESIKQYFSSHLSQFQAYSVY